jgi:hypothetical protein
MGTHDLPQTASKTIPNRCAADASRGNKSDPGRTGILHSEHTKRHQFSTLCVAFLFHALEFRRAR